MMRKRHLWPVLLAASILLESTAAQHAVSQPLQTVDTHLLAAQQAQRNQDLGTAEREYKAALALAPRFAEIHMNLGLVYQLQGRIAEAMAELTRSLQLKPELTGANLMLGIDLCNQGSGDKAIPYLAAAVRRDPHRLESYSWLATAQEMAGEYQAELVTIKHALKLQPNDADLLYLMGHAYERLGKEEVLRLNVVAPNSSLSERLLGESYATSSEWPSALLHFQNAIAVSPHAPGLHVELGEVLLRAGKLERATREFNEELQLNSHSLRALIRRGETELLAGKLDSSLRDWSQALKIDTRYTEHILGLLDGDSRSSIVEPPIVDLLQTIDALEPKLRTLDLPAAHLALAFIATQHNKDALLELAASPEPVKDKSSQASCIATRVAKAVEAGRLSGAAACGLRVLNAGSTQEFRLLIATSLQELGEYESSLQALSSLRNTPSPEVAFWRARCYEELSTAAYLRLYRTNPDSFRLHQLMADLAAARGDDKKAIEEYRAAIALKPAVPNLHYSLGHVLWKNSDVGAARPEFEAELGITPRHIGAFHDLGETYLMERQPQQALTYLNRAVDAGGRGPDLDRDLGTAYAQLGDFRNAEIRYNLALASDHDGSLHFKLAKVYQALGEKEKASNEFKVAASLSRKYHAKLEEDPRRRAIEE